MTHVPHELHEEFPEHADRIHQLKVANAHFGQLSDKYHEINRAIHRAETDLEPTDDFHLEEMKRERLKLKDEIARLLEQE